MQGTQTVKDLIDLRSSTDANESQGEDPEHAKDDRLMFVSDSEQEKAVLSNHLGGGPLRDEVIGLPQEGPRALSALVQSEAVGHDTELGLEDPRLQADLMAACQEVFLRYRQSTHRSWQHLQEDVSQWFGKQLLRGKTDRRQFFEKLAVNLLVDAQRRETNQRRYQEEICLTQFDIEVIRERVMRRHEDTQAKVTNANNAASAD